MTRVQPDLFACGVAEVSAQPFVAVADPESAWRRRLAAVDAMDDAQALEMLVKRCSLPGGEAAGATAALLARFGDVGRVIGAPHADLAPVVGPEIATELTVLHAVLLRALAQPLRRRQGVSSFDSAKTYLSARLRALPREEFHVLYLDTKNQLIADERMGDGSVDHAPVYPREVVRRALELSAAAVLLAHNHPSGDPTPSRADIETTKRIVSAAKTLGIAVYDHLIIGGDEVVSLRAQGLM